MLLTYQYRIKPSTEQEGAMLQTLELLRRHWNYALGQRLDWLNQTRCQIDRCSLVGCPIGDIPDKVDYYTQQSDLKQTKVLFPEYKTIWAEAQQINLQRLNQAWERWRIPDASGKRAGRPRFKQPGKLRSFTYPRVNCPKAGAHLQIGKLKLSKIGEMPVVMHRPLPQGFELKTCTIIKQADGWYASFSLKDDAVPAPLPMDQVRTAIGIDVGLKEFLVTSNGQSVPIQQHYCKAQDQLSRAQRFKDRKQPGSKNYSSAANRVARLHQRVERVRREFHYHIAHWLCQTYDLIGIEELNIRGLARTPLGKSVLDAAWGAFAKILEAVAVKRGNWIVRISPHGTTQDCSRCGMKVPKTLSVRMHSCTRCNLELDRDENAARNVLERALQTVGYPVSACGGSAVGLPEKQEFSRVILGSSRLECVSA